jgi:RED-like protein N-terminal region
LLQSQATLSTNDIVINKLAQILSYLRQGKNQSKKAKKLKEKAGMENAPMPAKQRMEDSIYGDIGDYVASNKKGSDGLVFKLIFFLTMLLIFNHISVVKRKVVRTLLSLLSTTRVTTGSLSSSVLLRL